MIGLPPQISRYRDLVDDWDAFVEALHRPLPTDLRWNPLAVERARFEASLRDQGIHWTHLPGSPDLYRVEGLTGPGLTLAYNLGWYHPQGYTSTLPPVILAPRPGSRVLDLCAAPGGKTSQLAAMMEGTGVVIANDVSYQRISILASNLGRLGTPNVLICQYRGENFPERLAFDHVLVDAPCTGQGTFRVEGGRFRQDDPDALDFMSATQIRLLRKALRVVRPGGTVLYSTCSYAPEEDEAVISTLLEEGIAEVVKIGGALPGRSGITEWLGRSFRPEVAGTLRFWPHHTDSWGFYCALLRRTG